jgi:phospholipase A1
MSFFEKNRFNWFIPALIWMAPNAFADELTPCREIKTDSARLACFDALAKPASAIMPPQTSRGEATKQASSDKPTTPGVLTERIESQKQADNNPFLIKAYKPNYILLGAYTTNRLASDVYDFKPQNTEAKFQLSFQLNWWDQPFGKNTAFYFGYSQLSFWQVYNSSVSAPFRETNYEPEIGLNITTNTHLAGLDFKQVRMSFIHQSNGQGGLRSRSWNRLAVQTGFERGDFAGSLRGWYRIPENRATDDNPDITDYLGYGDLTLGYKLGTGTVSATLRNNLKSQNRGSVELNYSFPFNKHVQAYVQYFNGYGESLIDYNRSINRIGIGFSLNNWF